MGETLSLPLAAAALTFLLASAEFVGALTRAKPGFCRSNWNRLAPDLLS